MGEKWGGGKLKRGRKLVVVEKGMKWETRLSEQEEKGKI